MSAETEATLDLFVEQTLGPLLGTAIMVAFEIGREAGIAPEALVLEMYMSGEMESVFRSFREIGFYRAVRGSRPDCRLRRDHAHPRARSRGDGDCFRAVLEDIRTGAFAHRFQDEASNGYPMLEMARGHDRTAPRRSARRRTGFDPRKARRVGGRSRGPIALGTALTFDSGALSRLLAAWGMFVHRHRWPLLLLSILSSGASLWVIAQGSRFDTAFVPGDTESGRALALLHSDLPRRPLAFDLVFGHPTLPATTRAFQAEVERAVAPLRGDRRVAHIRMAWDDDAAGPRALVTRRPSHPGHRRTAGPRGGRGVHGLRRLREPRPTPRCGRSSARTSSL